jgi:hypothetical protein
MAWKLRGLSRYRPRALTLAVLLVIAAVLVLANMSDESCLGRWQADFAFDSNFDVGEPVRGLGRPAWGGTRGLSYGWPLLWRQYVPFHPYRPAVFGFRYSAGRLAGNMAMWLVILAAPAAACEWMLRRYRPRLRWSLRTMLATVTLLAAFLGWFVWARDRADAEDLIIDGIERQSGDVWLERWGPTWLDLIGADRYRRRIVAARVRLPDGDYDTRSAHEHLRSLSPLSNLKYLFLEGPSLTHDVAGALGGLHQLGILNINSGEVLPGAIDALAAALREMPRLRVLCISPGFAYSENGDGSLASDAQMCHECLTAVGKATQLEYLRLLNITIRAESLACLASLTNLKLLSLGAFDRMADEPTAPPLLSQLPALRRLEAVDVDSELGLSGGSDIGDHDLRYLACLPRLKSLSLGDTKVTGAGLAELASLESLEELYLQGEVVSSAGVESLLAFRNLKRLHIEIEYQPGRLEASLQALRQTHPGIAIDDNVYPLSWEAREWAPSDYDTADRSITSGVRELVRQWKQAGSPP